LANDQLVKHGSMRVEFLFLFNSREYRAIDKIAKFIFKHEIKINK
jgi:hypothetical protein